MDTRCLQIAVRMHDGRFHGADEWAPSPARLFQALVAAAPRAGKTERYDHAALAWLETLPPPIVGTPRMSLGQRIHTFVPNNDLDALGGDPDRIGEIRTSKTIEPRLFDASVPFLFAWTFDPSNDGDAFAARLCELAERLYQFGRGVDMAWAVARTMTEDELENLLMSHSGPVYRPSAGSGDNALRCPQPGSLRSLDERHAASLRRFTLEGSGARAFEVFSQPPKPSFARIAYDAGAIRLLYDLQMADGAFAPWPLHRTTALVEWVRDSIARRLKHAMPDCAETIERSVVGRKGDDGRQHGRIRIVPLPSIGHRHVDRSIRRLLIEVPAECALRAGDIHWAASSLELGEPSTGVLVEGMLVLASDETMLRNYGIAGSKTFRTWRTVTPVALPQLAARRRIEPTRRAEEAKGGAELAREHASASHAVAQALRHSGVSTSVTSIRVQREPYESGEERAERFAPETRFPKERLWHVEVMFRSPVRGPLVIGDGRYLGLGVMHPIEERVAVHAFRIEGSLSDDTSPEGICRAVRNAVLARAQGVITRGQSGRRRDLPTFFTGHSAEGGPAGEDDAPHIAFLFDGSRRRVLVLAPSAAGHRDVQPREFENLMTLDEALTGFDEVRAGSLGVLRLTGVRVDLDADPLFAPSTHWNSITPYAVTRHAKRMTASEAVEQDVQIECARRGLRVPRVHVRSARGIPGCGLTGSVELEFDVPVRGPIILGRTRHLGGGVFSGRA